jgi:3-oxosteroid 1-dehydrogenase
LAAKGELAMSAWDHNVDLLIVGTGAGAMATAIRAHDRGGKPLLIEKTHLYGGSSAMSGGSLWIPNNHLMAAAGALDLDHVRAHIGEELAAVDARLVRQLEHAPAAERAFPDRRHREAERLSPCPRKGNST